MPVNAGTEIETWVNDYYPAFYVALTDQEDWTYTNYIADASALAAWHVYFTNLMTQMNAWKNATKVPRSLEKGRDLIQALYGYIALNVAYGTSFGSIGLMDAYVIYDMDGFTASTISNPVDWYDDMIVVGGPPPYTSAKMVASIATVTTSVTSNVEETQYNIALNTARLLISDFGMGSMFTDYTPTGVAISKASQQTYIYDTLHYLGIGTAVTTSGISIPPFPLP